jgi:hypothetical protein
VIFYGLILNLPTKGKINMLNPVEYTIQQFGGVRALARALGKDASIVSKWRKPRGGVYYIPSKFYVQILRKAKKLNLDITLEDLVFGRKA